MFSGRWDGERGDFLSRIALWVSLILNKCSWFIATRVKTTSKSYKSQDKITLMNGQLSKLLEIYDSIMLVLVNCSIKLAWEIDLIT